MNDAEQNAPDQLVVLTGAAGRLGPATHQALLDAGLKVRAVDWVGTSSSTLPVLKANLFHPATCRKMLQGATTLVHLAYRREPYGYANGYPARTFDDHIRLNRIAFQTACEVGIRRIIFSSSIQVIAPQLPKLSATQLPVYLPLDDQLPPLPDNWYALAKRCSEEMLGMLHRIHGIDTTVFRFPALVHGAPVINPWWFEPRTSEGMSYLTYLDAANVLAKAAQSRIPGQRTYLPASRRNGTGKPVEQLIRESFPGVPLRKPVSEMEGLVDISRVVSELGWEPLELSRPEAPADKLPPRERIRVALKMLTPYRLRKLVLKPFPAELKTKVKNRLKAMITLRRK